MMHVHTYTCYAQLCMMTWVCAYKHVHTCIQMMCMLWLYAMYTYQHFARGIWMLVVCLLAALRWQMIYFVDVLLEIALLHCVLIFQCIHFDWSKFCPALLWFALFLYARWCGLVCLDLLCLCMLFIVTIFPELPALRCVALLDVRPIHVYICANIFI